MTPPSRAYRARKLFSRITSSLPFKVSMIILIAYGWANITYDFYIDRTIFNGVLAYWWGDMLTQVILADSLLGSADFKCACNRKIRGGVPLFTVTAFRIKWHKRSCLIGLVNKSEESYG